jgi:hypothetical protein
MNIQLSNAEEWIDQEKTSDLGQVLIRYVCLWVGGRDGELVEGGKDLLMAR